MELINQLVSSLDVSEDQAKGGAGLIFSYAKEKLGGDFSQVTDAIPEATNLIDKAPSEGGSLGGMLGGVASTIGGSLGDAGGLMSLAGGFSKLGLDSGLIGKFVPIILSFVQGKAGDGVKNLLAGVLKI
ncbi:MAG: DUF2780 domain-containing protein [Ignavibacterium sp.]|nr:MAG: DUF2780 domain-containing protein [Ignavibacterium sp.]